MPIDPNIALAYRSPEVDDPMIVRQRSLTLANLAQQNEQNERTLDAQREASDDADAYRQTWIENQGDPDQTRAAAIARGVGPETIRAHDEQQQQLRLRNAALTNRQLAAEDAQHEGVAQGLGYLLSLAPEQRAGRWPAVRQWAMENGYIDASHAPEAYPGDDWAQLHYAGTNAALAASKSAQAAQAQLRQQLGAARNAGQWDAALARAEGSGAVPNARATYGAYSPDSAAYWAQAGLTPDQQAMADYRRAEISNQQVNAHANLRNAETHEAQQQEAVRHNQALEAEARRYHDRPGAGRGPTRWSVLLDAAGGDPELAWQMDQDGRATSQRAAVADRKTADDLHRTRETLGLALAAKNGQPVSDPYAKDPTKPQPLTMNDKLRERVGTDFWNATDQLKAMLARHPDWGEEIGDPDSQKSRPTKEELTHKSPGNQGSPGGASSSATQTPPPSPPPTGKPLTDPALARDYLRRAGGDRNKARQLARNDGYRF